MTTTTMPLLLWLSSVATRPVGKRLLLPAAAEAASEEKKALRRCPREVA